MKLKYLFEAVDMGEEIFAVPVGEGSEQLHGILKLNKEGYDIVKNLEKDISEDKLVSILSTEYGVSVISIANYVHDAIDILRYNGLLEE